ncbi:MAG: PHP domain-containing protein [Desulfobacteraceae bacterium]|nr:PHP domain-containing protein [Desulfobacteraceae bacterium]MDH3722237.1 PHP domain-containing protein [Desulfobacteraceae bacterium]MDH3874380.1 PHP domain-containing protein [Desulfobacteraceae bacterium]MDH3882094.1 PHP domain-containing protein [Desulfobacteraceae bacterium]
MRIDLHIHSTASDGTLSPLEILTLAQDLSIAAISITDHDTLDGSKDALSFGIPPSVKFLTGVEISAEPPPPFSCAGSFHILGYAVDIDNSELNHTLSMLKDSRKSRNPQILKRLSRMGIDISLDEVRNLAGNSQMGRPHIAQLMVEKGYAPSINGAFDEYLGNGRPAYVDRFRFECEETLKAILNAGGIPVLAHPLLLGIEENDILENLIAVLTEMGLKGIEVYYPDHTKDLIAYYSRLANHHNLLITGGTDFHGKINPEITMGYGKGDLFIPYELYEKLISSL